MQAVVIHTTGGREVLKLDRSWPRPVGNAPGDVLVKLHFASVNPIDANIRAGRFGDNTSLPRILGGDGSGIVVTCDEDGQIFKPGDRVAALTPGYRATSATGTYAEYAVINSAHLAHVPAAMPLDVAGGLPLVSLTAWQALQAAKPVAGQRLLVFAASGGVGHMAVQLGKVLGLHVAAVAGPSNQAWLLELGADQVLDYSRDIFAELAAAGDAGLFDIVFDPLPNPPDRVARIVSVLRSSGCYTHVRNTGGTDMAVIEHLRAEAAAGRGPGVALTVVQPDGQQLAHIFGLWSAGLLRLEVAATLPLAEVAEAHARIESGHTRGKLLLAQGVDGGGA